MVSGSDNSDAGFDHGTVILSRGRQSDDWRSSNKRT